MVVDEVEDTDRVRWREGSVVVRRRPAPFCRTSVELGEIDLRGDNVTIDGLPWKMTATMRAVSSRVMLRTLAFLDPSLSDSISSSKSEKSSAEEEASSSEERYT